MNLCTVSVFNISCEQHAFWLVGLYFILSIMFQVFIRAALWLKPKAFGLVPTGTCVLG